MDLGNLQMQIRTLGGKKKITGAAFSHVTGVYFKGSYICYRLHIH